MVELLKGLYSVESMFDLFIAVRRAEEAQIMDAFKNPAAYQHININLDDHSDIESNSRLMNSGRDCFDIQGQPIRLRVVKSQQ